MLSEHIFISYSSKNESEIRALAQGMRQAGLQPWYYVESQRASVGWTQTLMAMIEQARAVVVVVSPESVNSEAVLEEVLHAKKHHKLLIPLRLAAVDGAVEYHTRSRHGIRCEDVSDAVTNIAALLAEASLGLAPQALDPAQLIVNPVFTAIVRHPLYTLPMPDAAVPMALPTTKTLCTLGRSLQCEVLIKHDYTSKVHASIRAHIEHEQVVLMLHDGAGSAPSRNGTYVNGERITQPYALADGDQIGLGVREHMLSFAWLGATKDNPEQG